MSEKILKLFIKKGFLLDKEMLEFFNQLENEDVANEIIDKLQVSSGEKMITKTLINDNLEKIQPVFNELDQEKQKLIEKYFVNVSVSVEVKKETTIEDKTKEKTKQLEELDTRKIKIISSPIIKNKKLVVRDFVKNFRSRYNFFKKILQDKKELEGLTSIDKISGNRGFSIIAIVTDKRISKKKNIIT